MRHAFDIDGWKAVGTALKRIDPPEVIGLDILQKTQVEQVLDDIRYVVFVPYMNR